MGKYAFIGVCFFPYSDETICGCVKAFRGRKKKKKRLFADPCYFGRNVSAEFADATPEDGVAVPASMYATTVVIRTDTEVV